MCGTSCSNVAREFFVGGGSARFSDLKIGQFGMVLKRRKEKLGKTQGKYWIFTKKTSFIAPQMI